MKNVATSSSFMIVKSQRHISNFQIVVSTIYERNTLLSIVIRSMRPEIQINETQKK